VFSVQCSVFRGYRNSEHWVTGVVETTINTDLKLKRILNIFDYVLNPKGLYIWRIIKWRIQK